MKIFAALGAAFIAYLLVMAMALGSLMGGSASGSVIGGAFPAGVDVGLTPAQLAQVARALSVADQINAPPLPVLAMVDAGLGESGFSDVQNGQGSGYCGVFQGSPRNVACSDTELQARSFLQGGLGFNAGGAIAYAHAHPDASPGLIATLVETSGKPASFYDVHTPQANRIIAAWRAGAVSGDPKAGAGDIVGPVGSDWLGQVPGTSFQCDRRIVADVAEIIARWHVSLTACYAPTGHEPTGGEHPLGLAVDLVPTPPTTWDQCSRARALGRLATGVCRHGLRQPDRHRVPLCRLEWLFRPRRSGARRLQRASASLLEPTGSRRSGRVCADLTG
jgi:hypothetical protein